MNIDHNGWHPKPPTSIVASLPLAKRGFSCFFEGKHQEGDVIRLFYSSKWSVTERLVKARTIRQGIIKPPSGGPAYLINMKTPSNLTEIRQHENSTTASRWSTANMSDTKEPFDTPLEPVFYIALATLFLLGLAAIFRLFQRVEKWMDMPEIEEPPCMTELLARAAKYLPRPNKCSTNQQQQNACEQILCTHRAANGHRRLHSAESDVEVVVRRTL
jgi:hypothetical protein